MIFLHFNALLCHIKSLLRTFLQDLTASFLIWACGVAFPFFSFLSFQPLSFICVRWGFSLSVSSICLCSEPGRRESAQDAHERIWEVRKGTAESDNMTKCHDKGWWHPYHLTLRGHLSPRLSLSALSIGEEGEELKMNLSQLKTGGRWENNEVVHSGLSGVAAGSEQSRVPRAMPRRRRHSLSLQPDRRDPPHYEFMKVHK